MSERDYHLSEEQLRSLLLNEKIEGIDFQRLLDLVRGESKVDRNKPEGIYAVDPRDGTKVLFNSVRMKRPHTNTDFSDEENRDDEGDKPGFISRGDTTGIIDVASLSEGFTFINTNLFPVLYPEKEEEILKKLSSNDRFRDHMKLFVHGMHFLQWTSNHQKRDWHNIQDEDCAVVMGRIAALEKKLIPEGEPERMDGESVHHGYLSIFKNCGGLVGGSIKHGHQQIGYSSIPPKRTEELLEFKRNEGIVFSKYMFDVNPQQLIVHEWDTAVLMVPYFMRRPYDMLLLLKDTEKQYLHQCSEKEIADLGRGWKMGIRVMRHVLGSIGKPIAYNILGNVGPGCGIYFDFLPYTQETGGFEHLGLYVCQNTPATCAEDLRDFFESRG